MRLKRNRNYRGPRSLRNDFQPMIDRMRAWANDAAVEGAREGLRADGSCVRLMGEGPPPMDARCPNHPDKPTRWRGPMPGSSDAPITTTDGYECVAALAPEVPRAREASRLWRIADKYADKPSPFGDRHAMWQAAPCFDCLGPAQENWLDAIWPPPPKKRARGAKVEEGAGDWEL